MGALKHTLSWRLLHQRTLLSRNLGPLLSLNLSPWLEVVLCIPHHHRVIPIKDIGRLKLTLNKGTLVNRSIQNPAFFTKS